MCTLPLDTTPPPPRATLAASQTTTRQSEMADLARRATRWVGTCHTGMCMSNFMMIGWEMAEILHIEISRKHVSVTYDLDLWPKILKIFVSHGVPIRNMYAKFHNDRLRNGWDITLWNFAKTRTNTHTHTQTDMGITIPRPPPMGGEVKINGWINWRKRFNPHRYTQSIDL